MKNVASHDNAGWSAKTDGQGDMVKTTYQNSSHLLNFRGGFCGNKFLLLTLLILGFATSALARPHLNLDAWKHRDAASEYVSTHRMDVTMATIRVPVKLHHFLPSEPYSVQCSVYDRPHGSLRKRGDGVSDYFIPPPNGEVNTVVAVTVHPLKRVSGTSPLVTWLCHLNVAGKGVGSRLSSKSDSRAPFRGNVGGRF